MTVNNKISVADYNAVQTRVSNIMGAGGFVPGTSTVDPSYGYGQVIESTALAEGNRVRASDWNKIKNDLNNISRHQTGSNTVGLFEPAENQLVRSANTVTFTGSITGTVLTVSTVTNASTTGMLTTGMAISGSGVAANTTIVDLISGSPWGASSWTVDTSQTVASTAMTGTTNISYPVNNYLSTVTNLGNFRSQIDTVAHAITVPKGSASITFPGSIGTAWNTRLDLIVTVTFTTATRARYFFNSGGLIRFAASRSGGTISSQNDSWTNLLPTVAGVNNFGAFTPSSGLSPADNQSFYRLANAYSGSYYTKSASSPYGSNRFEIYASCPGITNNSTGTANTIQFKVSFIDDYTDPGPPAPGDLVDGTFTVSVSTLEASGTLSPASLGSWQIESPQVTFGSWTSAGISAPPPVVTPPSPPPPSPPPSPPAATYDYDPEWLDEYAASYGYTTSGQRASFLSRGQELANGLYLPNTNLGLIDGVQRYALFRKPDASGLAYWTNYALVTSQTSSSSVLRGSFFGGLTGGDDSRSRTASKSFDAGSGDGDFYDRSI